MAKATTPKEEKLENVEFDLFKALSAIDKKDYAYFDNLTAEQQKGFSPFMMIKWFSYVNSNNKNLEQYYVLSANEFVNKHLFNDNIYDHPKLVWLMLCVASPKAGFVKRGWIPQIKEKISQLREPASTKDIKDYYTKTYPNADKDTLDEISNLYVYEQNKKCYLAEKFPNMKREDIELLSSLITEDEIKKYEQDQGNI